MVNEELAEYLKKEWHCLLVREVPGHGVCGIIKYMFTYGIHSQMDGNTFYGRWCYKDPATAMAALIQWDGVGDPPFNWIKYKGKDGERQHPNNKKPWDK